MNRIDEIITKTINKFLKENINTEANNNLPIHEFDNDMKSLGFIKDNNSYSDDNKWINYVYE